MEIPVKLRCNEYFNLIILFRQVHSRWKADFLVDISINEVPVVICLSSWNVFIQMVSKKSSYFVEDETTTKSEDITIREKINMFYETAGLK